MSSIHNQEQEREQTMLKEDSISDTSWNGTLSKRWTQNCTMGSICYFCLISNTKVQEAKHGTTYNHLAVLLILIQSSIIF